MAWGISQPSTVAAVAAIATVTATTPGVLGGTLGDVRQQGEFACTLDRASDLALMTPAGGR